MEIHCNYKASVLIRVESRSGCLVFGKILMGLY